MIAMKLTYEKSHLFMHTTHEKWMVDTGAPSSISRSKNLTLNQDGYQRVFEVQSNHMGLSIANLTDLVGVKFDGLLGTDILNEFDIIWDIAAETMTLTEAEMDPRAIGFQGNELELGNILGIPTLHATIAGQHHTMFFDTGAPYSYLNECPPSRLLPVKEVEDFLPGFGTFTTDLREISIQMNQASYSLQTGELPTLISMSLSLAGSDGIIGNEIMTNRRLGYFPRRNTMLLECAASAI
jgi:hypothetical protein